MPATARFPLLPYLFALILGVLALGGYWYSLGQPVVLPDVASASHKLQCASYTPSTTKVVWNLFLSRIQWICSNNKKLCCEDKNNERQHLPLDSKQPAFQGAG